MKWDSRAAIIIALLLLLVAAFYLFLGKEDSDNTVEATVQLLSDEPTNDDVVSAPIVDGEGAQDLVESVRTTQVEDPKIEAVRGGSFLFINECSDTIAVRLGKEPLLLKPHERGYLESPEGQEYVELNVFRKTNGEVKPVSSSILHLSDKFHLTMTASEDEDGKFVIRGERVYLEKPDSKCGR